MNYRSPEFAYETEPIGHFIKFIDQVGEITEFDWEVMDKFHTNRSELCIKLGLTATMTIDPRDPASGEIELLGSETAVTFGELSLIRPTSDPNSTRNMLVNIWAADQIELINTLASKAPDANLVAPTKSDVFDSLDRIFSDPCITEDSAIEVLSHLYYEQLDLVIQVISDYVTSKRTL